MTRFDLKGAAHRHAAQLYEELLASTDDPVERVVAAYRLSAAVRDELDIRGRQLVDELRAARGVRRAAAELDLSEAAIRRAFGRRERKRSVTSPPVSPGE